MTGPYLIGASFLIILWATAVAVNTSTGGTRSDHDDGAGSFAALGGFVLAVGTLLTIVEVFAL